VYEVIAYRPELKLQIARLQRHLWRGDGATNAAYLEWKYERNPYVETPLIHLALHEGEAVAMRGVFGSCWEMGSRSERFCVPCADDLVIAPAHRNRRLLGRIMQAVLADLAGRGHRCAFSLSPGPVTLAGSLVGGWRAVGAVNEVRRPGRSGLSWRARAAERLRSLPYAWRWADRMAEPPPGRAPFRRLDRAAVRSPGRGVWLAPGPRPDGMADLVGRLGHDGRLRHVRDAQYLAWRFANPQHEYRFLFAGGESLDGYLVLQSYRLDEDRGVNIVDWEATTTATLTALLRAALDWGRFAELSAWTAALPEAASAELAASGFVPADRGPLMRHGVTLLARGVGDGGAAIEPALGGRPVLDASGWDMRMLYSMAG
jgi:hypothetical protein